VIFAGLFNTTCIFYDDFYKKASVQWAYHQFRFQRIHFLTSLLPRAAAGEVTEEKKKAVLSGALGNERHSCLATPLCAMLPHLREFA
jgi:hypothetical protein